jgi:hypothetical protein
VINPRLKKVGGFIDAWCDTHGIEYSVVCDESDLQGVLLFKKDRAMVARLLRDLVPVVSDAGVHLETSKVRGGTIFAFSVRAISESQLAAILAEAGEELEPMTFTERLTDAFVNTVAVEETAQPAADVSAGSLLASAQRIAEGQFKSATQGATRANQTSLQRQRVGSDRTLGGAQNPPAAKGHDSDDPQATTRPSQGTKAPPTRFENKIARTFNVTEPMRVRRDFHRALNETLQGMATPDGVQPGDLFQKFAQALAVLGQNMGTGPLQDQLKKQGINWKKSEDGQAVVLYVLNASTKAPQPIARISAETLSKPNDFQTQLLNIMDFAKGDAPGTFTQKKDELAAQEKAARQIAQQLGPQDPNAIAQQMAGGLAQGAAPMTGAAPAPGAAPTPGAPPQAAPQAAAQQAATPKPGGSTVPGI